jgi:hypothetical protein
MLFSNALAFGAVSLFLNLLYFAAASAGTKTRSKFG